ncbi:unnamed protein product [Rhizophagus irregularis]|nr:unnamed protein product [Rhizophagus irregularis]
MHNNNTTNNSQDQSSNITFRKKIYQFDLKDITTFIQQFHSNDKVYSDELKLGMYHLKDCLDLWLNEISKLLNINTEFETLSIIIEIYNAVKLTNGDWVRATEKFNNQKEYSNVAIQWKISSEIELVFGQVLLILTLKIKHMVFYLALVHLYDYKYQTENKFLKFGCPYIKFINEFYIVPIEVLIETVHIVQRFDHNNAYFVNRYISW